MFLLKLIQLPSRFLAQRNWKFDAADVSALIRGDHASGIADEVIARICRSLTEAQRDLLYRLSLATRPLNEQVILELANVEPPIVRPRECLTSLVGAGRVASVLVTTSDPKQFEGVINRFVQSLEPVVQPAAAGTPSPQTPVTPPAGGQALLGMWQGLGTGRSVIGITNRAGTGFSSVTSSSSLDRRRIVFFPDGTFCAAVPQAGFEGLDLS